MKNFSILIAFVILTFANSLFAEDLVKIEAFTSKQVVEQGEEFNIYVKMTIDNRYYTYGAKEQLNEDGIGPTPTEFEFEDMDAFSLADFVYSTKPGRKYDAGFEFDIDYYSGTTEFVLTATANRGFDFSSDNIELTVWVQLCDSISCLPPEGYSAVISGTAIEINDDLISKLVKINLSEETEESATESETIVPDSVREIKEKQEQGLWAYLLFAMSAGALSLLTPCVFPMIPITVSFFTKRAEEEKGKGLRDSIIYALGIITTFTLIGFFVSLIFGATGIRDLASSAWVNLFISLIFLVFAFNLFGAFEIQIPPALLNALNQKSQTGGGIISVLLMGLTFSLASFTCTVPFVGAALVSASGGEWFYPILGMIAFSSVLAAPFFFLALFPSYLQKLPKAGGWMNNVKVVMGFLVIAATMKFLSNIFVVWGIHILTRELFLAIWIASGIFIVLYILGKFRFHHDSPVQSVGTGRVVFALIFASITVWLVTGLFGKPMGELDAFLPSQSYSTAAAGVVAGGVVQAEQWHSDFDTALAEAKAQNKPVLLDFTGYTCTNCRWMENNLFPRPDVASALGEYVKVKLYTDRRGEPYQSNKEWQRDRFGSIDLPFYVLLTPDDQVIATKGFTRDEAEFVEFLQRGIK